MEQIIDNLELPAVVLADERIPEVIKLWATKDILKSYHLVYIRTAVIASYYNMHYRNVYHTSNDNIQQHIHINYCYTPSLIAHYHHSYDQDTTKIYDIINKVIQLKMIIPSDILMYYIHRFNTMDNDKHAIIPYLIKRYQLNLHTIDFLEYAKNKREGFYSRLLYSLVSNGLWKSSFYDPTKYFADTYKNISRNNIYKEAVHNILSQFQYGVNVKSLHNGSNPTLFLMMVYDLVDELFTSDIFIKQFIANNTIQSVIDELSRLALFLLTLDPSTEVKYKKLERNDQLMGYIYQHIPIDTYMKENITHNIFKLSQYLSRGSIKVTIPVHLSTLLYTNDLTGLIRYQQNTLLDNQYITNVANITAVDNNNAVFYQRYNASFLVESFDKPVNNVKLMYEPYLTVLDQLSSYLNSPIKNIIVGYLIK